MEDLARRERRLGVAGTGKRPEPLPGPTVARPLSCAPDWRYMAGGVRLDVGELCQVPDWEGGITLRLQLAWRDVWRAMSRADRETLAPRLAERPFRIRFEVRGGKALAAVEANEIGLGKELTFASDGRLRYVLAHEAAHLLLHHGEVYPDPRTHDADELAADRKATSWGFPPC